MDKTTFLKVQQHCNNWVKWPKWVIIKNEKLHRWLNNCQKIESSCKCQFEEIEIEVREIECFPSSPIGGERSLDNFNVRLALSKRFQGQITLTGTWHWRIGGSWRRSQWVANEQSGGSRANGESLKRIICCWTEGYWAWGKNFEVSGYSFRHVLVFVCWCSSSSLLQIHLQEISFILTNQIG